MELGLTGRAALVTGSTRGIGRHTALTLAREGCDVAVCGRTRETLDDAVTALSTTGRRVHGTQVDLLETGGVERFVSEAAAALGRLDVVVANVGGTFGGNFLDTRPEDWVKTFEVNLVHAVRVIQAAAPHLARSDSASVVIVASISGSRPGPRAQYGVAKAAEIQLAASLSRELAPQRIRVNTVSPGSILWEGGSWHRRATTMPDVIARFVEREFPWGRMGTLDEVANVITFLCSPRASWVNGADVVVDGAQGQPSIRL
ncbi:MAG: SDR family oxidoreductase [Myxococcaceae bacterium]|jgi:3-oxoacyl-[acyl-carrier protein] reductase|nr:SDR family oxidoreductase [Myxococcaceae bacterium]